MIHTIRTRTTKRPAALGALAVLAVTGVVALGGCGGSDKPGYCSDRSDLESAIKDIGNVKVTQSGGLQDLKTQLQTVETDAKNLVNSAKSDFPEQTNAISASVNKLKTDVGQLPSSPTPQQAVTIATDLKGTVDAVNAFKSATDSKCS